MMHPDLLLGVNKLASPIGRMAVSDAKRRAAQRSARPRSCARAVSAARRRHLQRAAASPRPLPLPLALARLPRNAILPFLQALLRWYLSGWHFKTLGVKKPYNPIVGECARVHRAVEALAAGDLALFGRLLSESHASLRDDFDVSTPELDAIVERARSDGALGARMTGGGFGGSAIIARRRAAATHGR
jgi:galactokinase